MRLTFVLGRSPIGSGKTLAFGLPLIQRTRAEPGGPFALVLVRTRELAGLVAADLAVPARAVGLRIAAVYSGAPVVGAQAEQARGAQIVVATPGRLTDLLKRRLISLDRVAVLVLDEADRMLDMGFKPQVEAVIRRVPRERQTMFFSATLDGEVGRLARD
jgi:ATP-dependent RNA helicase RhlE